MRNKLVSLFVIISICIFHIIPAFSDTPFRKLGRGIANVATCPLEVFKGIQDANKDQGFVAAFTWGILQGVFKCAVRGVVGAYEVVTFPIPVPKDYDAIVTDPEFFGAESIF